MPLREPSSHRVPCTECKAVAMESRSPGVQASQGAQYCRSGRRKEANPTSPLPAMCLIGHSGLVTSILAQRNLVPLPLVQCLGSCLH